MLLPFSSHGKAVTSLFLSIVLPCTGIAAEWEITESKSRDIARAVKFKNVNARTAAGKRASLSFVFFSPTAAGFRVVDQVDKNDPAYVNLADAMKKNGCIAGTNGGFFQKDFAPLGLQIADGQRAGTFNSGSQLLSGVFFVNESGSPQLVRRSAFKDEPDIVHLLQSGPYLVEDGRPTGGLDSDRAATRTFVFRTSSNLWGLGRCSRITLADLGALLANDQLLATAQVQSALNLDGGSSSGLWVEGGADDGKDHYDRSWANVRNFVGIEVKASDP
ncbi:MAG: phosphodiester glycosidase family protein [Verrucomicrobiota bacterium]